MAIQDNNTFECPSCGEDWAYGYKAACVAKGMIAKKKPAKIKCAKCRRVYPLEIMVN